MSQQVQAEKRRTDAPLFRLRAFETDWLAPLLDGSSELNAVLVAEAERWIELGQKLGYFAQAPLIRPVNHATSSRDLTFFRDVKNVETEDFAVALSDAQEDLTLERRALLQVVVFASDTEFRNRLAFFKDLTRVLVEQPDRKVPAAALDAVGWALEGAEWPLVSDNSSPNHPAWWRSSRAALEEAAGEIARRRLAELDTLRDAIVQRYGADPAAGLAADWTVTPVVSTAPEPHVPTTSSALTELTIGIETLGGVMTTLIARNTPLPAKATEVFSTAVDSQTSVEVHILQGERALAKDNRTLGKFHLVGIPPAPRGVPQIQVTFEINIAGLLQVSAKDLSTGKTESIKATEALSVSADQVDDMLRDAATHRDEDRGQLRLVEARNQAEAEEVSAGHLLAQLGSQVDDAARADLADAIRAVRAGRKENRADLIAKLETLRLAVAKAAKANESTQKWSRTDETAGVTDKTRADAKVEHEN